MQHVLRLLALNAPPCSCLPPRRCRARGMRAPFGEGAAEFMRQQLAEWIDWSLNKSVRLCPAQQPAACRPCPAGCCGAALLIGVVSIRGWR
jgi:hypothetical protein